MRIYRAKIVWHDGMVEVLDLSFSQLCSLLPPTSKHRNVQKRSAEIRFWQGKGCLNGTHGSVKLIQ